MFTGVLWKYSGVHIDPKRTVRGGDVGHGVPLSNEVCVSMSYKAAVARTMSQRGNDDSRSYARGVLQSVDHRSQPLRTYIYIFIYIYIYIFALGYCDKAKLPGTCFP